MITLNLTDLEKSDIKYEISRFPDGQQQVKIVNYNDLFTDDDYDFGDVYLRTDVLIKTRLNNFKDLEILICAVKSLKNLGVEHIELYVPYFLGSRSDRKFEEGSNNYLKDVICPIINSLNFQSVTVLDSHSDVLEACLNNFKKVDNKELIEFSLFNIGKTKEINNLKNILNNSILISPDAGANKKIFKIAEQIGYTGEIITCSKSRDEQGKLSRVEIPTIPYNQDCIIIDDICDGGATFINIAKELKKPNLYNKVYLIVTHGIFSKGFKELNQYFDGIYCTNSYHNITSDEYGEKTNVKQLNVF